MTERLGDAPIENKHRDMMNFMARQIDEFFNRGLKGEDRKVGFVLMLFDFGGGSRCNYISNANRAEVVTLLKEQLARFEGQPEMTGKA